MYDTAKAIVFNKPREAEIKEIRVADVDEETIVVRTKYSGISTGTEMAVYRGQAGWEGVWYPCVPGYEEVGEVVYAGGRAPLSNSGEKFKVGDRVMANEVFYYPDYKSAWGGQCGYAVKNPRTGASPANRPAKIPGNVSYQEAVVCYLACVAKKGADMAKVNPGETVLVLGMGVIGLSWVQLAKIMGAGKVIAADVAPNRLELAGKYTGLLLNTGGGNVHGELAELCGGEDPGLVVECSGNPRVVDDVFDYVKRGGRVHLQGQYREPVVITRYSRWNGKDITVSASIAVNAGDKEALMKLVSEGKFDAKNLYTEECSVDEAPEAYRKMDDNREGILKVLFKWED